MSNTASSSTPEEREQYRLDGLRQVALGEAVRFAGMRSHMDGAALIERAEEFYAFLTGKEKVSV